MAKSIKKENRGGKRPGSGRKSDGVKRKAHAFWVSEDEKNKVSNFLKELRNEKK